MSGDCGDTAVQRGGRKISAKAGLMFNPFACYCPARLGEEAREPHGTVISGNHAQLPFIVAGIWREARQAEQTPELGSGNFLRLDSDEFARRCRKLNLRVSSKERAAVGHKKLSKRRAREHEHESRNHRVCRAIPRAFAGWPLPRNLVNFC